MAGEIILKVSYGALGGRLERLEGIWSALGAILAENVSSQSSGRHS